MQNLGCQEQLVRLRRGQNQVQDKEGDSDALKHVLMEVPKQPPHTLGGGGAALVGGKGCQREP